MKEKIAQAFGDKRQFINKYENMKNLITLHSLIQNKK